MIFATTINGIPCYCRVDRYSPGQPDKIGGAFEDAEEGYDEEFDYTILDHRYIIAPWLERQLDTGGYVRMLEEYLTTVLEQKHFYGADDYDR
jgi:hypothetical protein